MAPQHRISHQKRREKDEMDLKERLLLLALFLLSGKTFVFLQKEICFSICIWAVLLLPFPFPPKNIIQTSKDLYSLSAFLKNKFPLDLALPQEMHL